VVEADIRPENLPFPGDIKGYHGVADLGVFATCVNLDEPDLVIVAPSTSSNDVSCWPRTRSPLSSMIETMTVKLLK